MPNKIPNSATDSQEGLRELGALEQQIPMAIANILIKLYKTLPPATNKNQRVLATVMLLYTYIYDKTGAS